MKNEGKLSTLVENETRRIPSISFLALAGCAVATSLGLLWSGRRHGALLVGQWVPSILLLGVYNKIAKTFTAPIDETERLRHGDHAVEKPNEPSTVPAYS